ncbi:hypothetical protein MSKU9_0814 [Komagataeibacter diospyri]|uniref:Uncharacterized protein n=1 Tax=Komagataeibacter diospyri TaxID=1932662 RepID=A0A4P5NMS7_9PROT|nr:hypothetical protein MSKU9_0814 [Komagataeibacter diospyri]
MVDHQITHRAVKKGTAGFSRKGVAMFHEPDKGFLHEVSGQVAVIQLPADIVGQFTLMARKQPADSYSVHPAGRLIAMIQTFP